MTVLAGLLALALHAVLVLATAPLLAGAGDWAASRAAGRASASPVLVLRDMRRLWRKEALGPEGSSAARWAAPGVAFGATLLAALLVPSFARGMTTAPLADLLVVLALLALARAALAIAAADAGDAAGAHGVSHAMLLAGMAAPTVALAALGVALRAGSTNLDAEAAWLHEGGLDLPLVLSGLAMLGVAAADLGAEPEWGASGRVRAVAKAGWMLRRLVWMSLVAALFVPAGLVPLGAGALGWVGGMAVWLVKVAVLAGLAALAVRAAPVGRKAPALLGAALVLASLATLLAFAALEAA